jgi:beta-lactam-binding protein with PASTA domain
MLADPSVGTPALRTARVPAGTAVTLVVEQDRGTAICTSGRRRVPDVVGRTLTQAERALGAIAYGGTLPPLPPSGVTRSA